MKEREQMKKLLITPIMTLLAMSNVMADTTVKGVNPADNLTKIELLPKISVLDNGAGVSASTLTLKYDQAIAGIYGLNFELPFARFEGYGLADNGLGDLHFRARVQHKWGQSVLIVGSEFVFPTATANTLGGNQYMFDPAVSYVYAFNKNVFVAGVAKQFISLYNQDSNLPDTTQSQFRMLLAYVSDAGWWALADPQIWVNYDIGVSEYLVEFELGKMVSPTTGVWLRAGSRVGGDWQRGDWSISGGIRFLSF